MPDSARLTPEKMNCQIPMHSEEFLPLATDLLSSRLLANDTAGVLLSAQQPRGIALLLLRAGGKPSTWFPPGGLVELFFFQNRKFKKSVKKLKFLYNFLFF